MSKNFLAHLYLFFANLIYGVSFTIAKDVVPHFIGPFGAIVIRVTVSLILFVLVHALFIKEKIRREDVLLLFACGVFGVAINQLFFFKGISITTPIHGALIMTITPILVLLLSGILKDEKITPLKVSGILIGIMGALVIVIFGKEISFNASTMSGDLFVMLNATSYAVYLVIVKPLMKKYHPLTIIKWVFLFGWIFVVPAGWNEFQAIDWKSLPPAIWFELSFIVIATTFFAYLFNILALQTANPSVVGIYIYVQPALATIFAMILGRDDLNAIKILATALIFAGVYLVSLNRNQTKISAPEE
ncbi:MAG TPA: EamA family transporter [Bacteroidetes bacterium]|nr:EamA family transporter [Bacteroidota bacterium]